MVPTFILDLKDGNVLCSKIFKLIQTLDCFLSMVKNYLV